MATWLELARGPLFALSFLIMLLGLGRHITIQVIQLIHRRHLLREARWRMIVADTASWVLPIRHLVRGAMAMTVASILFHVGIVLVPLFLADHIALWERLIGVNLPELGPGTADILTVIAIAAGLALLGYRILVPRARVQSRTSDHALLILVLLPMVSGFLAAHAAWNPTRWELMMLIHILSAETLFVVIPFSKLAHVVLFPFERLSQAYWYPRPGAGEDVARALRGEELTA